MPELGQDPETIAIEVRERRILRIKGLVIAGRAVTLTSLDDHASLIVQTHGLGGRHHMGAGVFVPLRRST